MTQKKCSKCDVVKDYNEFHRNNKKKDGRRCECKECVNKYKKEYRIKTKEKILKKYEENINNLNKKNKKCSNCEFEKEIEEFHKSVYSKDGRQNKCKECTKEYNIKNKDNKNKWSKEYYEKTLKEKRRSNREQNGKMINEKRRKYYQENKEKILEYNRNYREENKDILNENCRNYNRNKFKTDEQFRIKTLIRTRVRQVLKGKNKSASTMDLLGCSVDFLRNYLEGTKVEGKDYSDAHIDHIRPCASFDLTDPEQQRECFHYTNLQYLPAKENISKGAKILT